MGFKMRSGNKTTFKDMGGSDGSPLHIGKWSSWMAAKQKHVEDEIQARREPSGGKGKKGKKDKKKKDDKIVTDNKKNLTDTKKEETPINRAQRAVELDDPNKQFDEAGQPVLSNYATQYNKMAVDDDGKRINPRNDSRYGNLSEFEAEGESWWEGQAEETDNEKLKKQDQEYGLDADGNVKFKQ